MKIIDYKKVPALFLLAFSLLAVSQWVGAVTLDGYGSERFTVTGQTDSQGRSLVRWEQGTLYVTQGFIAITSSTYTTNDIESIFKITASTLTAINGKFVDSLSSWTARSNTTSGYLGNYQRSSETYSVNDIPYVIVSVKGSSGSNNTTGNVCTSTSTTITAGNPTVSISVLQPNAAEAGSINGRFQIDLDAPRAKKIVVAYTISGSASNGKDYAKIKNSVVIPAGTTSAYVDITPINDKKKEVTETVTLNIKASGAYSLGSTTSATVNIAEND